MALRAFVITFTLLLTLGYAQFQKSRTEAFLATSSNSSESLLDSLPADHFTLFNQDGSVDPHSLLKDNSSLFVHFWATWCGPCEAEFPSLVRLARQFSGIKFLLVAVNDKELEMKKFLKRFGSLPTNIILAMDNRQIGEQSYGVIKVPETFVVDSSSAVVKKFVGPQEWDEPYYSDFLQSLKLSI